MTKIFKLIINELVDLTITTSLSVPNTEVGGENTVIPEANMASGPYKIVHEGFLAVG